MPRHSLADKEQEWHVLDKVRVSLETNIAHFVSVKNERNAQLLRGRLKVTNAELERLRDLMWRDLEKYNVKVSLMQTLKAVDSITTDMTQGRVNYLLK